MILATTPWPEDSETRPVKAGLRVTPERSPGPATRFTTRLADGRELFYFDSIPGIDRSARDERERTDAPVPVAAS